MSRASDVVSQLEDDLEIALNETQRLTEIIGSLEDDLRNHTSTISEQDDYIADLEATIAFVEAHYPDAIKAYDVRQRMEKASGPTTAVG